MASFNPGAYLNASSTYFETALDLSTRRNTDAEKPKKNSFECLKCEYKSDRKNNLARHVNTMHKIKERPFECCTLLFRTRKDFKNHVDNHHKDGYQCFQCLANFRKKAILRRHIDIHTGEKRFKCDHAHCRYASNHKSNLQRHQKTHSRTKTSQKKIFNQIINDTSKDTINKDDKLLPFKKRKMFSPDTGNSSSSFKEARSSLQSLPTHLTSSDLPPQLPTFVSSIQEEKFCFSYTKMMRFCHSIYECYDCDKMFPSQIDLSLHYKNYLNETVNLKLNRH